GEALVAIPLLTLALGIQTAAPVAMLMASGVTLVLMAQNWRMIDLRAIWRLALAAVVGIPLGVWGLKQLPEIWLTTLLGILLIGIGLYYLRRPTLPTLMAERWTYLLGFCAGVLGGAYNIAGPPLIIYGTLRRWPPEQFRSTLQGFFIFIDVLILIGHAGAGLWTPTVLQLFALSIPAIVLGLWAGNRVSAHLSAPMFERLLYGALIVLGVMLMV
ncbi:MAG: sulfite exporter TauE/SafE family protein, partial [Anaerolineae bacterium]|nr:sulfite exporter TauE/SafE family protein [Anaerolineae bacterium]